MPNRYPLRTIAIVDRPPSKAERIFAFFVVSSMLLTSAVMILL